MYDSVYALDGKRREVNISKGGFTFPAAKFLDASMRVFESRVLRNEPPAPASVEALIAHLAVVHGELLFIHSSYIPPAEAVMEKIALSPAFHATRGYHIAEITTNLKLLKKWVLQEKVEVRKDNP